MKDMCSQHKYLRDYLDYVEETESPRIFHVWSALSAVSACLGRRVWYEFGHLNIYPNMYVVLSGPSGVRKSSALSCAKKLLKENTSVHFAPDDTGGQRQGIISAMAKTFGDSDALDDLFEKAFTEPDAGVDALSNLEIDTRDPHHMYACQEEFNSFIGEKNTQLMTFLQKMYDGDDYEYQLKSTSQTLKQGLLGILGATTPAQIALSMPQESVGQGFTSRVIFVFAGEKYKSVPRPIRYNPVIGGRIAEVLSNAWMNMEGPMKETPEAAAKMDQLYEAKLHVNDTRFTNYATRRHQHLQKLVMAIAASGKRMEIREEDVILGDAILCLTEKTMPDALGEFGMSKLSAAKQRLIEFIKGATDPVPADLIGSLMSRDMTALECAGAVNDLKNSGQISAINLRGKEYLVSRELKKKITKVELNKEMTGEGE